MPAMGCLNGAEDTFVVADLDGHLTQLGGVLTAVVCTKEQVGSAGQDRPYGGACAAPVATLSRRYRRSRGCRRHHVLSNTQYAP
jgi:hypothetical protein